MPSTWNVPDDEEHFNRVHDPRPNDTNGYHSVPTTDEYGQFTGFTRHDISPRRQAADYFTGFGAVSDRAIRDFLAAEAARELRARYAARRRRERAFVRRTLFGVLAIVGVIATLVYFF